MDLLEHRGDISRRHPWETARAEFFLRLCAGDGLLSRSVLDVGAGDAWFAALFCQRYPRDKVVCWDAGYTAERVRTMDAAAAGLSFVASAPEGPFDLVLLLDVIEHVQDDVAFLRDVLARLRSGGTAIVSVPAWPWLYGAHDVHLGHCRRYSPAGARNLLSAVGIEVEQAGGLFHALLPARALTVLAGRLSRDKETGTGRPVDDLGNWGAGAAVTRALDAILRFEGRLSRRLAAVGLELPGLSWWARCRKL
ncbi:MAG: methyltransferase domain-containing protein [Polyangia bacterium]